MDFLHSAKESSFVYAAVDVAHCLGVRVMWTNHLCILIQLAMVLSNGMRASKPSSRSVMTIYVSTLDLMAKPESSLTLNSQKPRVPYQVPELHSWTFQEEQMLFPPVVAVGSWQPPTLRGNVFTSKKSLIKSLPRRKWVRQVTWHGSHEEILRADSTSAMIKGARRPLFRFKRWHVVTVSRRYSAIWYGSKNNNRELFWPVDVYHHKCFSEDIGMKRLLRNKFLLFSGFLTVLLFDVTHLHQAYKRFGELHAPATTLSTISHESNNKFPFRKYNN